MYVSSLSLCMVPRWDPHAQFSYTPLAWAPVIQYVSLICVQCCTLWQILELMTAQDHMISKVLKEYDMSRGWGGGTRPLRSVSEYLFLQEATSGEAARV